MTKWFSISVLLLVLSAVLGNLYLFLGEKNYEFVVEAPCDQQVEKCFIRSCDDEECPPNNLTSYKLYALSAEHFESCTDNSCVNLCSAAGGDLCTPIECDEEAGDICFGGVDL